MSKLIKANLIITDIGFILYWTITAFHLFPPEFLFNNYNDSKLVAWNWSFMPMDIIASILGLCALFFSKQKELSKQLTIMSMCITFCAGLMAISFWVIVSDFELMWWLPNLYLMLWPLILLPKLIISPKI